MVGYRRSVCTFQVALVFRGDYEIEQRVRPSQYAEFFAGTSVGEYFYKRVKEVEKKLSCQRKR